MYDFLRGTVVSVDAGGHLTLDVNGVGYSLRISEQTRAQIALDGRPVTVHVRLQVKEDDLVLFGFSDVAERSAFDLLISVQQVGPSVAMAVLSTLGVMRLREALLARDAGSLRKVKGVGPKSAERIVLELADKVERIPAPLTPAGPAGGMTHAVAEARRALVVLGFSPKDAGEALVKVAAPGMGSEDLLRQALALLR